jgi:cytochrome c biogenesis protein CcmG, thiol:disulfide interchange protein DsbE
MNSPEVPEGTAAPTGASGAVEPTPRASVWARLKRRGWHWSDLIWIAALLYAAPTLLPHLGAVFGVRDRASVTPIYTYRSLTGEPLSSDALRGKVVLVNFWATWCAPCRAEMPVLEAMYQRHRENGFVIVGLAVDRAPTREVEAFVRDRGVTYPIAHVGAEAEALFGGVRGYPTSFLIGRDGVIQHTVLGPIGAVSLEPAVRRALREPGGR